VDESPVAKVRVAKVKARVIQPYSSEQIKKMLRVCDHDFQHGARFLGSRNLAIILMLLDSGLRLSELANIKLNDIDVDRGWIKVMGKGNRERVVRIGKTAQRVLWRFLTYRGEDSKRVLWLSEERKWGRMDLMDTKVR